LESFKNYNIILVTLDGLREDKIDLCHSLSLMKKKALYFSNMITVSPYTLASLHAIFSGLYPSKNGVDAYYHMFKFKNEEIITIPQMLQKGGYYTSCDIISDIVIPKKGFDERNIFDEKTVDFKTRHEGIIRRLSKKEKFFLFLHYTEPHKHLVDEVIQKYKHKSTDDDYFKKQKENEDRYNSYMPSCDRYITSILKCIKDCGIEENTILIFHADHGTSIGEKKGEKFYGVYVYDYTIKVFCFIYIPKKAGKIIKKQCSTIDLYPTIGDIAGIDLGKKINNIQGESLFPLVENPNAEDREVFVETGGLYGPWPSPKKHNVFCIRLPNKKLIYNADPKTWEFYDLKNDPHEMTNLYDETLPDVIQLKKRLLSYFKENNIVTNITNSKI